jgi:precorrin-6B C5,15-methyltransferase / cobalt-precorrin-6B C5,C15-methyltransferase
VTRPDESGAPPVAVVGLHGGQWFGSGAEAALCQADVLIGSDRQHQELAGAALPGEAVELWGRLDELVELCEARSTSGQRVCVLAAGDPGFFGIVRLLAARLGPQRLEVHPAPSSISLAFARVGIPWDDAVVATCHGRPVESAARAVAEHPKAAVLVSPQTPPAALGEAVLAIRSAESGGAAETAPVIRDVWVCTRLGEPGESVTQTDLAGLATGAFDPLSVVVCVAPGYGVAPAARGGWGADESTFAHRAGLITKAEVRAVVLGKLELPTDGVLWDVGAGSGSVAIEAARLCPGLRVLAVERDPEACALIRCNAEGAAVAVIEGTAPGVLADLPSPDRVFVGGGGLDVLDAARARLRPGGVVVATYAVMAGAVAAADRLGSLVQLQVSRARSIGPDQRSRLQAENPVFVAWGRAS